MSDEVSKMLAGVWKDLAAQGYEAQASADGATLLKVEGGKLVLLHVAKLLGYEVAQKGEGSGPEGAASGSKPGRAKKAKAKKSQ
jgi:hypothetical protein